MKSTCAFVLSFILVFSAIVTTKADTYKKFDVVIEGVQYNVKEADFYGDGYTNPKTYLIEAVDVSTQSVLGSFLWEFEPLTPTMYCPKVCYPFYATSDQEQLVIGTTPQLYPVRPLFPTAETFNRLFAAHALEGYAATLPMSSKILMSLNRVGAHLAYAWNAAIGTVFHRIPVAGFTDDEQSDDQSEVQSLSDRLTQLTHSSHTDYLKSADWTLERKDILHQLCIDLWCGRVNDAKATINGLKVLGDTLPEFGGTL